MSRSLGRGEVSIAKADHLQSRPINSPVAGQSTLNNGSCCQKKVVKRRKPSYRWRWFGDRGIGIVLLWSFAAFSFFSFYLNLTQNKVGNHRYYYFVIVFFGSVLLPVIGLLTDVYIGRYRVIKVSLLVMWVGAILLCLVMALTPFVSHSNPMVTSLGVTIGLAFGVFQVNIVQFSVDQLSDSSSDEIISFITWYIWTYFTARAVFDLLVCTYISYYHQLFAVLVLCFLLTLAVASDFLFNHWLVKEPVTHNPLKLIFKVLRYAVQNKYPRERSAFTYWDDKRHSRIDLAKNKYGGPFTTEQVEDVKTFFRMQYLLWIGCAFLGVAAYSGNDITTFLTKFLSYCWIENAVATVNIGECLKGVYVTFFGHHLLVLCKPFYEFLILPMFGKWLPKLKIFTQMIIGALIIIIHLVGLASVEVVVQLNLGDLRGNVEINSSCVNPFVINDCDSAIHNVPYHWIAVQLVLSFMYVVGVYLLMAAGIEFVSAQAPYSMKGLIFGSVYSSMGVALVCLESLFILFRQTVISIRGVVIGCVFWFFLTCVVLSVVLAVMFVIASHCYKNRQRDCKDEDEDLN